MVFVESCTFINCHSPDDGGGIDHTAGQIVVAKTCSISCTANDYGQFFCSNPSNADHSYRNDIHECSVIGSSTTTGYSPFLLHYGTIVINSVNVSKNKCTSYSAIWCQPNQNGKLVTGTIKYSHVEGNEATTHTCLYMWYVSGNTPKHLITHTNHDHLISSILFPSFYLL